MRELRKVIVLFFCAVMLASCGGGQNAQNGSCPGTKKDCPLQKKKGDKPKFDAGRGCPSKMRNPMDRPDISPEQREKFEKWMRFDSLSVDEQKALLKERKAEIDERESTRKARKAEMEAKWADFDNLSIEEQKRLLDIKGHIPFVERGHKGMRPGCMPRQGDRPRCPKGGSDKD